MNNGEIRNILSKVAGSVNRGQKVAFEYRILLHRVKEGEINAKP